MAAGVVVAVLGACGSSSTPSGASTDGGASGDSARPGVGGSPALADGTCSAFYTAGDAEIMTKSGSGAGPAPMGGAIVEGDYVLTDVTYYGAGPATQGKERVTKLHFGGGFEQYTDGPPPSPQSTTTSQIIGRSFETSGTRATFREVCHTPLTFFISGNKYSIEFTATPTQYLEFETSGPGVRVSTYTHQ